MGKLEISTKEELVLISLEVWAKNHHPLDKFIPESTDLLSFEDYNKYKFHVEQNEKTK